MKRMLIAGVALCLCLFAVSACNSDDSVKVADQPQTKPAPGGMPPIDYVDIPLTDMAGEYVTLADYRGKVILLVNVASKCGYTPQYAGLEKLYGTYKDSGLVIIGVPANNFGNQEPGTNEEILEFCRSTYDVTFPILSKISVKGDDMHALYAYLTQRSSRPGEIGWNFTKFLFDREGLLVERYPSKVTPEDVQLVAKIQSLL